MFPSLFSELFSQLFSSAYNYPILHTYWRFYSHLNTLSMMFLILFAPNTTMASIAMTAKYRFVFKKKLYFIHDVAPCDNSKRTRTFLECKGIPRLEWSGNLPK